MSSTHSLVDQVTTRLSSVETQDSLRFSPELLNAMKLADAFSDVTPDPYVLPLDALAGFSPTALKPPPDAVDF